MQPSDLLQHFADASVKGIPLVLVVIAAVYWVKGLGVAGNALRAASLLIGFLLGAGYQVAVLTAPLPADPLAGYALIFAICIYGLALGLAASALVDQGEALLQKVLSRLLSGPTSLADGVAKMSTSISAGRKR